MTGSAQRQVVQLDLRSGRLLQSEGYSASGPKALDSRVDAEFRHITGDREWFVWGTFFGCDPKSLIRWLEDYNDSDVGRWAGEVTGDFNVIAWNRTAGIATAVSDRVGAHRLYVHCSQSVATFSDRLFDQARLQQNPRLNPDAVLTLLTFGYPLDPHSLLHETFVVAVGESAQCNEAGTTLTSYYKPVKIETQNFRTVDECVGALDGQFRATFRQQLSADAVPFVMVSGGIDSVVMLRYLTELAPGQVESLTYATEGQSRDELVEGRLAAEFYGTRHHTIVLPTSKLCHLTRRALVEGDNSTYGGIQSVAVSDFLRLDGRDIDVFRGEDTRLHTPSIDLPTRVGLWAHRTKAVRHPAMRFLCNGRALLKRWPFRRGQNYLSYVSDKLEFQDDVLSYVLRSMVRFSYPPELRGTQPLPNEVRAAVASFPENGNVEQIFRWAVALEYRLQYTENMHDAHVQCDTANSRLRMPFYDPEVVAVSNRVPLAIGLKTMVLSPRRTRSPFPIVDKYLLRKLLEGSAPPELLYRRKSTAPAMDVHYHAAGEHVIIPVVRLWGEALIDSLPENVGSVAGAYRDAVLQHGGGSGETWSQGAAGLHLCYLAALHWLTKHQDGDLERELAAMDPCSGLNIEGR